MKQIIAISFTLVFICSFTLGQIKSKNATTSYRNGDFGDDINGRHMGNIKNIKKQADKISLTMTYSLFISPCPDDKDCPDDYYICNKYSTLHNIKVSSEPEVILRTHSWIANGNFNCNEIISLTDFIRIFNDSNSSYVASKRYFWINIKDGIITKIEEQYLP